MLDLKSFVVNGELISTHLFQTYLNEIHPGYSGLIAASEFMYLNESEEPDMALNESGLFDDIKNMVANFRNCDAVLDQIIE